MGLEYELPDRSSTLAAAAGTLVAPVRTARHLPALGRSRAKARRFDYQSQLFEMIHHFLRGLAGKNDGKFLSPTAVCSTASGNAREPCRHQF